MTALSAPWSDASQATALGDGLTLACAVVFAGQIVALGRVAPKHSVLPLVLVQLATTGALAALAGPFVEAQHFSGAPRLWAALVYLALFATLLAFGIQTWAQKVLPPVRVALISALELANLADQAVIIAHSAFARTESRGAHAREDYHQRDDKNWLKHTCAWKDEAWHVSFAYRPVHLQALSNDVQSFPPAVRTH